jgi:SAM-dependent methyltransferase
MSNVAYDKMKDFYNDIIDEDFNSLYENNDRKKEITEIKLRLASIFEHGNILELAAGGGFWTTLLSKLYNHVYALDQKVDELEKLQKLRQNISVDKVDLLDFDQISKVIKGLTLTGCFASCWISHILRKDLVRYLEELIKSVSTTMTPGSNSICFIDSVKLPDKPIYTYPIGHEFEWNQYQKRKKKDGSEVEVIKNFYDLENWVYILESLSIDTRIVEYREWENYYLIRFTW